ncbi:MAG: ATP synthase F1 subunit delta [Planctomycetota bacterium]
MPLIEAEPDALAQIYAQSLFELATDAEKGGSGDRAETVLGELEDVLELARADASFSEFLASRVLSARSRDASLLKILENNASDLTVRFLRLLNHKERLGHLHAIVKAYDVLVQDAFGRVEVDVFTASKLGDADRETVRERVAAALSKEVVLHDYTDPAMLGGIKIRVGDRLVDHSLATQLRRVRSKIETDGGAAIRARAADAIDNSKD